MPVHIDAMYGGTPRPLGPRGVPSSIVKSALPSPWSITEIGLAGDVQADAMNHGGRDKAVHHYPREHYAAWLADSPALASLLATVPAFGENISSTGMTEANVCIGDVYQVGSVHLQVSQGRQPCWKLNARFDVHDMAYRVQKTGRTGWYYRVLRAGHIESGNVIALVDRPQPDWPLSRLISLLYHRTTAFDELAKVVEIPELAEGWRQLAGKRAQSRTVESWKRRLTGDDT
jgi:MOSC domain-containing protein YiiM